VGGGWELELELVTRDRLGKSGRPVRDVALFNGAPSLQSPKLFDTHRAPASRNPRPAAQLRQPARPGDAPLGPGWGVGCPLDDSTWEIAGRCRSAAAARLPTPPSCPTCLPHHIHQQGCQACLHCSGRWSLSPTRTPGQLSGAIRRIHFLKHALVHRPAHGWLK